MRKEEKLKAKGKRKDIPVECRVPRKARRDKKAFLRDQCKEIGENNRMAKTRDLLSVSDLFALYCSWGSQGKNEVVYHSLLQWTTFCQNSPP